MSTSESNSRATRLLALQTLLLSQRGRQWRTSDIAQALGVSDDTAARDMRDLSSSGKILLTTSGSTANFLWTVVTEHQTALPPLRLDYAQGAALYAAARLLSQQQDERNDAVRTGILNLIGVMPEAVRPHLLALLQGLAAPADRENLSAIFGVLAQGWLSQRIVQLTYEPAHHSSYTCQFAPYLLEPSGIGYTMYFIGHSDPPGSLRTYKLERVRHAELTNEPFTIPLDFDGPALLQRAWGVMYGNDEPVHVKVRFSVYVARRVRETRWHASEALTETPGGLIWEADIGDTTEIRPWLRGWGSDCEVLEPVSLREEMQAEVRRMARNYGVALPTSSPDAPDQKLLDDLFA